MATPDEVNEQLKATAAAYNSQNPAGQSEDDAAAIAAAHALNQATGSQTHSGQPEVRADTPEEAAAAEAKKKAEAEAAEKAKAEAEEKARLENETAEQKEAREQAEAEAAKKAAEEEAKAKEEAAQDAEWITTDNKQLNAAIGLMKKAGVTPAEADAIFGEAVNSMDISKLDEAKLTEKVGEDAAALIMSGLTSYVESEGQAVLERVKTVQDAVGGKENWAKMTAWARDKAKGDAAFKAEIVEINKMMNGDSPFQAKLAAQAFKNLYEGDSNNSSLNAKTDTVDVTAARQAPPSNVPGISARAYAEAVQDAQRELKGGALQTKLRELSIARDKGRKQGI